MTNSPTTPRKIHLHSRYNGFFKHSREDPQWVDKAEAGALACLVIDSEIDSFQGCVASQVAIAVAFEPPEIKPGVRTAILKNAKKFRRILTFDPFLLALLPGKAFTFPVGGSHLLTEDLEGSLPKSAGISISVSEKIRTRGQRLRHNILADYELRSRITAMGGAISPYQNWGDPYRKFMYNIAIENSSHHNYFTEKLLHPLLMGTIPIYCGASRLPREFDEAGIVRFRSLGKLRKILPRLDETFFEGLTQARAHNRVAAIKYMDHKTNLNRVIREMLIS